MTQTNPTITLSITNLESNELAQIYQAEVYVNERLTGFAVIYAAPTDEGIQITTSIASLNTQLNGTYTQVIDENMSITEAVEAQLAAQL